MKKAIALIAVIIAVVILSSCYANYAQSYSDFTVGESSISESITELSVEWISGSVTLTYADTDSISFKETASKPIPETHELCYKRNGYKLTVAFSKSSHITDELKKDLTITIPAGTSLSSLSIETVSADIYVSDISVSEDLSLKTVSGKTRASVKGQLEKMSLDTISGNAGLVTETVRELNAKTVSGDVVISSLVTPETTSFDSMSGYLEFGLPDDADLTLNLSTISGKLTSDFATASSENTYKIGAGSNKITATTISGDIKIIKLKSMPQIGFLNK